MNQLLEQGRLTQINCGANFAYVLQDNCDFLTTEYKVLQSQTNGSFMPCMKMLYNGKVQLFYLIKNLRPLLSMLPALDAENFLTVVSNLLSAIIDVKLNGFLSCQSIDVSHERIYVDPATYKVWIVYVPVQPRLFEDTALFENLLRTELIKVISGYAMLQSPKTLRLSMDLSNGGLKLEDVLQRLKGGAIVGGDPGSPSKPAPAQVRKLRIVAMNAPVRVELTVDKPNFVIGKNKYSVDGVVSFNNLISRTHCRISCKGNRYMVTDLHSANGTYVNGLRLQPDVPNMIENGDIIRLANSDFQVLIS